jgi:hypothetical protein
MPLCLFTNKKLIQPLHVANFFFLRSSSSCRFIVTFVPLLRLVSESRLFWKDTGVNLSSQCVYLSMQIIIIDSIPATLSRIRWPYFRLLEMLVKSLGLLINSNPFTVAGQFTIVSLSRVEYVVILLLRRLLLVLLLPHLLDLLLLQHLGHVIATLTHFE